MHHTFLLLPVHLLSIMRADATPALLCLSSPPSCRQLSTLFPPRPPTPLQDLLLLSQQEACQAAAAPTPNFGSAAALLRVWARAQGVDSGADGLGGFLLTMLLVDLVQKGTAVRSQRGQRAQRPAAAAAVEAGLAGILAAAAAAAAAAGFCR